VVRFAVPSHTPLQRPKILKRRSIRKSLAGDISSSFYRVPSTVIMTFAPDTYAQRLETVSAIYDKLCRYKYVQVCFQFEVLQQILT